MKLVLKAFSSDENYNGNIDYCFIDITPEYARQLLFRISMAQKARLEDECVYKIIFGFGEPCRWFSYAPEGGTIDEPPQTFDNLIMPQAIGKIRDDEELLIMPDDFVLPEGFVDAADTVSSNFVEANYYGEVEFVGWAKHSTIEVRTPRLRETTLKEIAYAAV